MFSGLSTKEIKLLSIISRLVAYNNPTIEKIIQLIKIKIPDLSDCWEQVAKELIDKGIVVCEIE